MVEVRLFGPLRDFEASGRIQIEILNPISGAELRRLVHEAILKTNPQANASKLEKILKDSAIASESELLKEEELIQPKSKTALLPPVCGG